MTASGGGLAQGVQRQQARGYDQRLGDRGVADRVGVGLGAVGDQVDPGGLGVGREQLACAGQFKPGGQETGGLGSLSGTYKYNHPSILPRVWTLSVLTLL